MWEYIYGLKPERIAQLNILVELCHQNGYDNVRNAEVVMIFRDWSKTKAKHDSQYPQHQVARLNVEVWPQEKRMAYIRERVMLHQMDEPPICTQEERWQDDDVFAVMKNGNKRAAKLCKSRMEAEVWIADRHGFTIVERPSVAKRCEDYCGVKQWCKLYKETK